jgi:hypothetical protein
MEPVADLRAVMDAGGQPAGDIDFVSVDDGGSFAYEPSPQAAARDFEYAGEAACIVDRQGNNYPLHADGLGGITLGPSLEKADLAWMRQAWHAAQAGDLRRYPLIRREPDSDREFLGSLFEVLALLQEVPPAGGSWAVYMDGRNYQVGSIRDLNALLAREGLTVAAVEDPYGHRYRTERRTHHALMPGDRNFVLYRELGPGELAREFHGSGGLRAC